MTYKNPIRFLLYLNLTYIIGNAEELKGTNESRTFRFTAGGYLSFSTMYRYYLHTKYLLCRMVES